MNTHRCNLGSDTVITCYVRDADGPRSLSAFETKEVLFYPYGSSTDMGLTLTATEAATGKVTFTVSAANAEAYFLPGVMRFVIKGTDGATTETLYSGLLEAV